MESLYIIVPAYNEEENIVDFINNWYPVIESLNSPASKLILINDGSKDKTYELLMKLAEDKPLLIPLTKPNGGHGQTLLYGYSYAIRQHADWIFQTDSDGQTNPEEFKQFWKLKDNYDAILGNRQDTRQDGVSRKFVENVLRIILKIVFGVNVPDANAPFRLMKSELVKKYIEKLPEDFNLPNVMLTTYFVFFHENVKFMTITFKPRQGGINSINIKKIINIGWRALSEFIFLKRHIYDIK